MTRTFPWSLLLPGLIITSCGTNPESDPHAQGQNGAHGPLLSAVPATTSGITFSNTITESPDLNYFTYVYAYNGAGVAVGDIDNDGLADIYFTGNQAS
ncbi:MAG TPA: VCBS repeat-containing protein, partial [Flavobacteriales bacterium]|nr:VCBS repeat-containing protein [Flavobacteriales bacterium]